MEDICKYLLKKQLYIILIFTCLNINYLCIKMSPVMCLHYSRIKIIYLLVTLLLHTYFLTFLQSDISFIAGWDGEDCWILVLLTLLLSLPWITQLPNWENKLPVTETTLNLISNSPVVFHSELMEWNLNTTIMKPRCGP